MNRPTRRGDSEVYMKLTINITHNDLEVRLYDNDIGRVEIIKWLSLEPQHCYQLAMFRQDKEGYNLEFVGSRPFATNINHEDFWQLAHLTQVILDEFFDKDQHN